MATIDEKLQFFSQLIRDKVKEEKQKDLDAFDAQKEERIKTEKELIEKRKKETIDELSRKVKLKTNEIVAKEKLDRQQRVLKLKESLVEKTMNELSKKLYEFVDTKEYESFLKSLIEAAKKKLEKADYIVYISSKDYNRFAALVRESLADFSNGAITVKPSDKEMIGGIIVEDSTGRFRMDNSLVTILEDNRDLVGLKVMERLE